MHVYIGQNMASALKRSAKIVATPRPVETLIQVIRGRKVPLDRDLAALYGVKSIALRQQVARNRERFPADFMFQLTAEEAERLVSHSVIPSRRSLGGFLPYVFTQEGVAMLSSVLRSERAVQMNIDIMRAFVRLRQMVEENKDIAVRVEKLERGQECTASVIEVLVEDIDRLADEVKQVKTLPPSPKRKIGFQSGSND